MQQQSFQRGRPAGQLTPRRRDVLNYLMEAEAQGKPIILGEIVRRYRFADRSDARRVVKDVRKMFGHLIPTPLNDR